MMYSLEHLPLPSACTRTGHVVEVKTVRSLKHRLYESPVIEACKKTPTGCRPLWVKYMLFEGLSVEKD
jgi:hypothetical protein